MYGFYVYFCVDLWLATYIKIRDYFNALQSPDNFHARMSFASIQWESKTFCPLGTQLLSTTIGVKEYVQSEFAKVEEEILFKNKNLFPGSITCDNFLWAFGILRSRAFSRLRGDNLALIPFADLVSSSVTSK